MFKINFTQIILKFGLTLLIFGAVIFVIGVQINSVAKKTGEIVTKAEAIRAQENNKQDLQEDSEQARVATPILEKALPASDNLINFIGDLENIATVTGNKQELNFSQEVTSEGDLSQTKNKNKEGGIDFTIILEGTFGGLQSYLASLEDLPYIIEIKKIASNGNDLTAPSKTTITAILYTSGS